jgi:hypothetical protein
MDISALRRDDFEVTVPFGEDASVLIRHVTREELLSIRKKATKTNWDRKHQREESFDPVEADVLLGRAAVRGWKGITMNDEDFPYTPENCDFLMRKWTEFARFVNDACVDLGGLVKAEREAREKNSWLTSGQGSTSLA